MFEHVERLYEQMEQEAINVARNAVRAELVALNQLFPRHTFMYDGRQGLDYVRVTPSILGEDYLYPWTFSGPNDSDRRASQFRAIEDMIFHLQKIVDIDLAMCDVTCRNTEMDEVF